MARRRVKDLMQMKHTRVDPGTQFKFRNNKGGLSIRSMKTRPGAQIKFSKSRNKK